MANLFGRYVWLIDLFRQYDRLTFEEVNRHWRHCGLGYGEDLPKRTFHNHRQAISDIFGVDIACDEQDGYRYYIENPERLEGDRLRVWLIDTFALLNQIEVDSRLEGRILYEEVPSGREWLQPVIDAMRESTALTITYRGFGKPMASTFDIEPYYLRMVKRRWYIVARSPYFSEENVRLNRQDGKDRPESVVLIYSLDRILDCQSTDRSFVMDPDFDLEEYFRGACGIIHTDEKPIRVVLKTYGDGADYLRTLPIHPSQREITAAEDGAARFELEVRPTFDLYQALLAQADQVEVLEPESIREGMRKYIEILSSYYHTDPSHDE